jgi:hypothetical protein
MIYNDKIIEISLNKSYVRCSKILKIVFFSVNKKNELNLLKTQTGVFEDIERPHAGRVDD